MWRARKTPALVLAVMLGVAPVAPLTSWAQSPLSPEPTADQPPATASAPIPPAPKHAAPTEDAIDASPLAPPAAAPVSSAAPKSEATKSEAPKSQTPKSEAPKAEAPKSEAPKAEAPRTEVQAKPAGAAPQQATTAKPKPKPRPKPVPREMALSDDPTPVLQPETFFTTAKASERYAAIVDAGGWPTVPSELRPGSHGPAVEILRRRLAIEGDLAGAEANGDALDPGAHRGGQDDSSSATA